MGLCALAHVFMENPKIFSATDSTWHIDLQS
jgi:hypothetical protein